MSWLKSLLGDGELTELPEELTKLIAQAKRDAKSLRGLLKRSETASKKIEDLTDPLEALRATAESLTVQMSALQEQADSFKQATSRIDAVATHATGLAEWQAARSSSSEEAERTISELTIKVNELQTVVGEAMAAKHEITDLLDPKGGVTRVRNEVDELMRDVSRLEVRSNDFAKVGGRIEAILEQARDLEEDQKAMGRFSESVAKRVAETDAKVTELNDGLQSDALVRQELEDLSGPLEAMRVTGESLASRMSALQEQADSFEKATSSIDAVTVQATDLAEWQAAPKRRSARSAS